MAVKLLTEYNLEILGLKGGYTGLSKSTLVKMPHCWKSHVTAQILYNDHAGESRVTRGLHLGQNIHLLPYSVYASRKGSGETALIMCVFRGGRLGRAGGPDPL